MIRVASPMIGRRYAIEGEIGRGGMGEVYRATDRLHNQTVALKRVLFHDADSASVSTASEMRLALAREFRTLASLRHPHIISVLDYGFDHSGQPYLAMEYLDDAQDIVHAANERPLDIQVDLLLQMLQALNYLHWRGIIHRDLKPDNVLVTNGQVKVLDFGLATGGQQVGEDADEQIVGTLLYMSPEMLVGMPPNKLSDLYAVGVIAFKMIAGYHPFGNISHPGEIINAVLYELPDLSPLDHLPTIKPIIERLISKNPGDRYQSVAEVMNAIDDAAGQRRSAESSAIRESFLQAASFVGRESEMTTLTERLERAIKGEGSTWLIGGESGVGKSRLLNELRIRALVKNVHVLVGQGVSGGGLTYQVWREPLRHLLLTTDLSDEEASRLKPLIPDIGDIIGRDIEDLEEEEGARQRNQQLLIDVILKVFQRQSNPVALFLEDLQWTNESLDVLKGLIPLANTLPLLIIGSYRHDERPTLPDELPGTEVMILNRLSRGQIIELSSSMLGDNELHTDLVDLLHRETEGNVFFLIEVLRTLAETAGQLTNIGAMTLPPRVVAGGIQQVIQGRLERVPENAQRLLRIAALYGRQLDLKVLQQIDLDADLPGWLLVCSNAAILEVEGNDWRFAHDKVRESLLAQETNAADLHRLIGEAIEAVYPDVPEQANRLAYHWGEAGDGGRERYYSAQAGQLALKTFAFQEAVRYLERALSLNSADDDRQEIAFIHNDLGHAYQSLSLYTPASEHYAASIELYRQADDMRRLMLVLTDIGFVLGYGMGQQQRARELLSEALMIAERLDDIHIKGRVHRGLGSISFTTGDYQDALQQARAYKTICETLENLAELARSWNLIGVVSEFLGDYAEALHAYQQCGEMLRDTVDPGLKARILRGMGEVLIRLGRIEEAEPKLEEGIQVARSIGEGHSLSLNLSSLAGIAARRKQFDQAFQMGRESVAVSLKTGHPLVIINALNRLGDVAVEAAEMDEGLRQYREALKIAHEKGTIALASHSFSSIATVMMRVGEPERAAELLGVVFNDQHSDAWAKQKAEELFNHLREVLPQAALQAAITRGQRLPLKAMIADYLGAAGR